MYYAIIGDMIGSRRLTAEARRDAQARLASALETVNSRFGADVAARFIITLGDEFQGLLNMEGDPVFAALTVLHEFRPYGIRLAIGSGPVTTAIDPAAAIGADGPAFYNARRMVDGMKPDHGARLRIAAEDAALEYRANTVLALCDKLALGWTDKQEDLCFRMLSARLSGEKLTQTALAESCGIGQSTVNAQLVSAGFNEWFRGIMLVRGMLSERGLEGR